MIKKRYLSLLSSLFFAFAAPAEEISEKIDLEQGAQLVKLAIAGTPNQGAAFDFPPKGRLDTLMIYQIYGKYQGTVAWIAVNPWTGDVWNMDECHLFSNPALLEAQAKIKKQFQGEELKEYDRLHKLKPYRMYDLELCGSPP